MGILGVIGRDSERTDKERIINHAYDMHHTLGSRLGFTKLRY